MNQSTGVSDEDRKAIHPQLAKRSVGPGPASDLALDTIGATEMVEATGKGHGRKYRPGHEITILDTSGEIATVKVASNVLWQRRSEERPTI